MEFDNKTKISNYIFMKYFEFCKPVELKKRVDKLIIKKYTNWNDVSGITNQGRFGARIMIKMCFNSNLYPHEYLFSEKNHKLGYLDFKTYSPEETLIYVLSHEIYHVRQYELGISEDRDSEFNACVYGLTKLQEYRNLNKKGFYLPKIGY